MLTAVLISFWKCICIDNLLCSSILDNFDFSLSKSSALLTIQYNLKTFCFPTLIWLDFQHQPHICHIPATFAYLYFISFLFYSISTITSFCLHYHVAGYEQLLHSFSTATETKSIRRFAPHQISTSIIILVKSKYWIHKKHHAFKPSQVITKANITKVRAYKR